METLWQDIRYGLRMLARKPGFTAVAVLTLALGIGANTTIFSVLNTAILNPLPFKDSDRMVYVWKSRPNTMFMGTMVTLEELAMLRRHSRSLERIEAYTETRFTLAGGKEPEHVAAASLSPGLLSFLGVSPQLGRAFVAEDLEPGAELVVLLGHGLWKRRYGADPGVLGEELSLNDQRYTIIGVAPPEFKYPSDSFQLYLPLKVHANSEEDRKKSVFAIARRREGMSLEQAQAEMETLSARLDSRDFASTGWRWKLVTPDVFVGSNFRTAIWVLFGAVGFVLLIACANVANLLLARATARQKEIAIRAALGARRRHLVQQLLIETSILAALGGGLGLLLALWGLDLVSGLRPENMDELKNLRMDRTAFVFMFGVSLFSGLLFGVFPSLQASRPDLNRALKDGARTSEAGTRRPLLRNALVVVEVALSLMLLVGAGLLINSFVQLQGTSPGFNPQNLLTMQVSLDQHRYGSAAARDVFFQQLVENIRRLPGVEKVALATGVPPRMGIMVGELRIEGRTIPEAEKSQILSGGAVSPGYFQTLGIQLLRGKTFTEEDKRSSDNAIIINEAMANHFWPGENPIGRRMSFGRRGNWRTVIGTVGNVHTNGLGSTTGSFQMYFQRRQWRNKFGMLVVRTATDPSKLIPALKSRVRALDANQPIGVIATVEQMMWKSISQQRFLMTFMTVFAALAMMLAAVGIYGVISYSVSQRTHEIGIRTALGAQRRDIFKLVVGQGMGLVLTGVAIGLAGAFSLSSFMSSLLFEVSATDPATFAGVAVLLMVVALLACYVPARRAAKVDPMVALRFE